MMRTIKTDKPKKGIKGWFQKKYDKFVYKKHYRDRVKHFKPAIYMSSDAPESLYYILAKRLENVLDYAEKDTCMLYEDWNPKMLNVAIRLARHLACMDDEPYYPEHINMNNLKRFIPERRREFFKEDQFRIKHEMFYDIKAKHLLFSIIETYNDDFWYDD